MIFRDPDKKALKENRHTLAPVSFSCSRSLHQTVFSLLLPLLLAFPVLAQETETADSLGEPAIKIVIKPAPVLYEPQKRRDPFLHIEPPKTASVPKVVDEELPRGTPPPGIAGILIDNAGLEGIVARNNQRFVIVRGADNRAYFLHEGDRLFDGYLKTIEKDSVVFVRETFMRSGKTLTQEITKRLRKS